MLCIPIQILYVPVGADHLSMNAICVGNCLPSENGEAKGSGCVTSSNAGGLSAASSGVIDEALPLDSAWVRCDDCLKWRRISEQLADSIGLTNCRWYHSAFLVLHAELHFLVCFFIILSLTQLQ